MPLLLLLTLLLMAFEGKLERLVGLPASAGAGAGCRWPVGWMALCPRADSCAYNSARCSCSSASCGQEAL